MASSSAQIDLSQKQKVADIRSRAPHELQETKNCVWHKKDVLGRGSFGKVCRGWQKETYEVVAVKLVRRDHYERDRKVRENLEREINIQKQLADCENVVRLFEMEKTPDGVILVMEVCDCDLQQHLKKVHGLKEDAAKDFLKQMAAGLKTMYGQGIAHRDLKPGNILLKKDPLTNKIIYKLADFGFARSYLSDDERSKLVMESLAGTPVFMAPEALECVFYQGKSYDEKVDLWSVGALLYNCLVGKPGFYANLQIILEILKKKGTAIAFDRNAPGGTKYIHELPSEVNSRLSRGFKDKMNELLRELLRLNAKDRMTYEEFFQFVDRLTVPEVVVFHVGRGYRYEISRDPKEDAKLLYERLSATTKVPLDHCVALVEQQPVLKLSRSGDLPECLKADHVDKPLRIFVYNEHSLDSSDVPSYFSSAVINLTEHLETDRSQLIRNPKVLFQLCELVLMDSKEWTKSQIKGLACYRALLHTCAKDANQIAMSARNAGEKLKERALCVRQCMDLDKRVLTQLQVIERISTQELDRGFDNLKSEKQKFLSQVDEVVEKCQTAERNAEDAQKQTFDYDYKKKLQQLTSMSDDVKRHSGADAEKVHLLVESTQKYHQEFLQKLHSEMRNIYFVVREGRFMREQSHKLGGEQLEQAMKDLTEIQKSFKQAFLSSLLEAQSPNEKESQSMAAELMAKEKELEKEKKTRQQIQEKFMKLQNEKAEWDSKKDIEDETALSMKTLEEDYSILPSPESMENQATVYNTAKEHLLPPSADAPNEPTDSPDGPVDGEAECEATIQPIQPSLVESVKVPAYDVRRACTGLRLASNFYHNLAREGMSIHLSSSASASADSEKGQELAVTPSDGSSKAMPHTLFSISASDIPELDSSKLCEELKALAAEVEGFEYKKVQDAVHGKVSMRDFKAGDLMLFWPTKDLGVYRGVTNTSETYVLHRNSVKFLSKEVVGRSVYGKVKSTPVATCAKEGDKFKVQPGQKYYTVKVDVMGVV